ncbi:beta-defensin 119 isoform X1 [Talpa occidentalis]|uniref:beta-defensin 119 isoform X1 n=1 Tax=Talpa occidentalis TaxID=50954 RepID=UPI00188F423F|nr:beta-defensin 119 isoform X1 [Talpa occidentalis]
MKLLFLTLAIFLALESGRSHLLQCMGNKGICRDTCKKTEQPYFYCRNYQPCCLQSYMRININGLERKMKWIPNNRWPKLS